MLDEILLWISGDFFFWGGGGIWGCFGLVFFWLVLAVWTVDFCEKLMQRMRRKDNMDFI